MLKKLSGVMVGLGLLGGQACAVDSVEQTDNIDSAGSALTSGVVYEIKGVQSGKCLDIANWGTANGANVHQWACHGGTNQQFKLEDMGSGYYRIRNVNSGKCLDVWNLSTSNGANIAQYTCGTGHHQQFQVVNDGGNVHHFIARHSGKSLDVAGFSTSDGGNIQQWTWGAGSNQKFYVQQPGGSACYTNNGVNPMLANLAVAMAKGIGEINAVRDLKIENSRVKLSTTGRNKCTANGGCTNIDAILDMQNDAVNSVLPTSLFDATNYRNTLVASYERQLNWEQNLANNDPGALPEPHRLVFSHEFDNGGCDTHFVFDALKAGCSGGSSCLMDDPNDIVNRLAFFENGGNDFLAFYATAGEVAIDPTGTMVEGAESESGSCVQANQAYSEDGSINGTCCQRLNGVYGTFQKSSFNPTLYLCKAN